ncbi:hypothetical protein EVAR_12847_1 [Eumeta japonica]|uniref:Uncharacterized protein n=1 Tax=Eumeta variegata TaxID=151549 RepID=A0A4C1UCA9_EUMVA|nr:hypothetical protein EVAR_12847_1 [Eumeta japonica]
MNSRVNAAKTVLIWTGSEGVANTSDINCLEAEGLAHEAAYNITNYIALMGNEDVRTRGDFVTLHCTFARPKTAPSLHSLLMQNENDLGETKATHINVTLTKLQGEVLPPRVHD